MDPMHLATANHEAAHAAAAIIRGHRVTSLWMNGGTYEGHTIHLRPSVKSLEDAAIARIGGLYAGDDWLSDRCRGDRIHAESLCPPEFAVWPGGLEMWGDVVCEEAEQIAGDPEFRAIALALSTALIERWSLEENEIAGIVAEVGYAFLREAGS